MPLTTLPDACLAQIMSHVPKAAAQLRLTCHALRTAVDLQTRCMHMCASNLDRHSVHGRALHSVLQRLQHLRYLCLECGPDTPIHVPGLTAVLEDIHSAGKSLSDVQLRGAQVDWDAPTMSALAAISPNQSALTIALSGTDLAGTSDRQCLSHLPPGLKHLTITCSPADHAACCQAVTRLDKLQQLKLVLGSNQEETGALEMQAAFGPHPAPAPLTWPMAPFLTSLSSDTLTYLTLFDTQGLLPPDGELAAWAALPIISGPSYNLTPLCV